MTYVPTTAAAAVGKSLIISLTSNYVPDNARDPVNNCGDLRSTTLERVRCCRVLVDEQFGTCEVRLRHSALHNMHICITSHIYRRAVMQQLVGRKVHPVAGGQIPPVVCTCVISLDTINTIIIVYYYSFSRPNGKHTRFAQWRRGQRHIRRALLRRFSRTI